MAGPTEVVVVDASVVVKWFAEEAYTEDAIRLRGDYRAGKVDLWAPSILPYEVLNALRYNPEFGLNDLTAAATALETYSFALVDVLGSLAADVMEIATRLGLTIYDASYLALAHAEGWNLYTADERLAAKAAGYEVVHHIMNYES